MYGYNAVPPMAIPIHTTTILCDTKEDTPLCFNVGFLVSSFVCGYMLQKKDENITRGTYKTQENMIFTSSSAAASALLLLKSRNSLTIAPINWKFCVNRFSSKLDWYR